MPIKTKEKPKIQESPVKVSSPVAFLFPFEIWFHIRKKKSHWLKPMSEFAKSHGVSEATLEDWDKLFATY